MSYTPNWSDPRVQKKVKAALGWASSCLSDKPRQWNIKELNKWFGRSNQSLGRYLRDQLLTVVDDYYVWGTAGSKCKTYTLRQQGVVELLNVCDEFSITTNTTINLVYNKSTRLSIARDFVHSNYKSAALAGAFEYKDNSNRLWHPLQNLTSDLRKPLMAELGYVYEYDIECAAPTLIYQLALNSDLGPRSNTQSIQQFLADPNHFRTLLSKQIGCDISTAKKIINARFAGATLRADCNIHKMLGYNYAKLKLLKSCTWFTQFSKDIKKCWDKIKHYHGYGKLSPKVKWSIYFQLERSVLNCVRKELIKQNIRYFLEHDGWRCSSYVDPYMLKLQVKKTLGYDVRFSYESYV